MRIIDLRPDDDAAIRQAAALLIEGFQEHWPEAWSNMKELFVFY